MKEGSGNSTVLYREGGAGIPPPPPEILKLSMVITVLSQVLNNNLVADCVRSNLRGSNSKFSWGSIPGMSRDHFWSICAYPFSTKVGLTSSAKSG